MLNWGEFLSEENFELAWEKVRRNNGCAGVDGETVGRFGTHAERNLAGLRRAILLGRYQPLPLRSLSVPKKSKPKPGELPKTEWRGLAVPTVRDRIVQQALLNLLHPLLEPQFEDCSFAYRPGRSYLSAVRQVDIEYVEPPCGRTEMQMAFEEALRGVGAGTVIPPPLYVVLGYKVRESEKKKVEIVSKEFEWREGMSTLYLVKQGMALRKEQGRFWVKAGSEGQSEQEVEVPIREVERVLVFGNIQLSTAVIGVCLEEQIPVVFLSQLGSYKGHLWSSEFCDLKLQSRQFRLFEDEAFQERMVRQLVRGKLWNSKQLLLKLRRSRDIPEMEATIAGIERDWRAVGEAVAGVDINVLRGYEGVAAARYFPAMGKLITNGGFSLTGRSRRPPKDPVNSLLSFGYTLLFNNVLSIILGEGLNPYLGNLHRSERNDPHLAFDLMEEWRSPIVDSLVMTLVNQKVLRPTDFSYPTADGGVYLEDRARRLFLKHFEERISALVSHPDLNREVSYRRAIQLQVQRYKRALLDGVVYEPFRRAT